MEVDKGEDPGALTSLAILINNIEEAEYQATVELPIKLRKKPAHQQSQWSQYY
jgi:hypothetical protein